MILNITSERILKEIEYLLTKIYVINFDKNRGRCDMLRYVFYQNSSMDKNPNLYKTPETISTKISISWKSVTSQQVHSV